VGWVEFEPFFICLWSLDPPDRRESRRSPRGKKGREMGEVDVRIKQTTVRRNLSSPFPEIGRVANVPKISFPNNIGRLSSSPRGTASDE
jgi:hypothetical protein